MSSIIRSSSSSRQSASTTSLDEIPGADPLSASKGHHRTRSGRRFGTSIVNTPSKSAKKNKEGGGGVGASTTKQKSTAKKNRSASRLLSRASSTKRRSTPQQQQHLPASLPAADLSYDFASISLSQSFGSRTNFRSTSVGVGASSSSESRDDYEDVVAMRRLPSAITADYSAKMSGTAASISSASGASSNFVNAASIFRPKKNTNKTGSEIASTIPAIRRSNPIFDTDRHYTINFESDDDSEEREGVATTTELGNYVIRHAEQQQKKGVTEDGASSIDSIFRMVDKVLDTTDAAMFWMCLQRANPIIDSDDEDAAIQHHDLHLNEETSCYQPERMWSKRKDAVAEEKNVMVLEMGNQLADEVNGYKIPMPR